MMVGVFFVMVAMCGLQITYAATTNAKAQQDFSPIFFPGPTKGANTKNGNDKLTLRHAEVPEQCRNKTYCDVKPKNYPQEFFNQMFRGTKATAPMLVLTGDRQNDPDEKNDCPSKVEYKPLYEVQHDNEWRIVAQALDENYVQLVRLETCQNVNTPCFSGFSIPDDVKTFCKQITSEWEFLVQTKDGKDVEKVKVELPMCCSCYYKAVGI